MTQVDEEPRRPNGGGNPRGVLLAVGAGVLTIVALAYASQPQAVPETTTTQPLVLEEPEPVPTTSPTTATDSVVVDGPAVGPPLADYLPEAAGNLVTSVTGSEGTQQLITSPSADTPTLAVLPPNVGPVLFFDAGDNHMAFLGPVLQHGGHTLHVGDTMSWAPIATQVTSFTWHSFLPGRIAWVQSDRGLCYADIDDTGSVIDRPHCIPWVSGRLTAFDDHGVLLVDQDELIRLSLGGEEVARRPGNGARVGPDGRVLIENRDPSGLPVTFTLTGPDLDNPRSLGWAPTLALDMSWSHQPNRAGLAFLVALDDSRYQLQVWDINGDLVAAIDLGGRYWDIEWDRSGRYVLIPGTSEIEHYVFVYDSFTTESRAVPYGATVQDSLLVIPARCEDAAHLHEEWMQRTQATSDGLRMTLSRDARLDSWRFLSGRIGLGPNAGEVATWALPAYSGEGSTQQWIAANEVAEELSNVTTSLEPADYGVDDWMLLDGAQMSQWCLAQAER